MKWKEKLRVQNFANAESASQFSSFVNKKDYENQSCDNSPGGQSKGKTPSVGDIMRTFEGVKEYLNGSNMTINTVRERDKILLTGPITTTIIPALCILIFVTGLSANGLALWIMSTKIRKLPSTIFLINLATADLLLILVLPFKISYHLLGNDWLFGEGLCRTMIAFFYGNMYCSILLLTFISIDRYFALVHPFLSKRFRDNRFAACGCCVIWVIAVLLVLPFLFVDQLYQVQDLNITTCHDVLPLGKQTVYFFYYFVCLVIVGFLIPCCVTVFCYGSVIQTLILTEKKYKRAAVVTALILLVYVVCFTPSNIILLIHHSEYRLTEGSDLYIYYMFCLVLSSSSSCIDPFIYYYLSDEFRAKVRQVICCHKGKHRELSGKTSQELLRTTITSSSHSRTGVSMRSI
ncbi:proteinase-activated receptor 3-like isoform X2 [Carcharodon carcharias]|uniref:proteinase-activated receptor 3-like isoform X2 n=1 Tax=Carcharodon carcharias TaxID=13397 RepID=UPI001B7E767F|nr:proteinase-activated receptor 3-like isoform X2 [Carcharodon carcharias]